MRESKSRALPLGDTPTKTKWGGRQVSNLLPPEPQSGALPIELRPPSSLITGAPGETTTLSLRAPDYVGRANLGSRLPMRNFGAPGETTTLRFVRPTTSGGRTSVLVSLCATLVRPERLEPPTHGLEGRCSILLSYGRINCKL